MAGHDGLATSGLDHPLARALIEHRADHLLIELDVAAQIVLFDHPQDVLLDLMPGRVALAPVGLELPRIRVHVRLHITGRAGVVVVAPGATHLAGFFQNDIVIDARFLQLHGHAQAAKACTGDGDFNFTHGHRSGRGMVSHGNTFLMNEVDGTVCLQTGAYRALGERG